MAKKIIDLYNKIISDMIRLATFSISDEAIDTDYEAISINDIKDEVLNKYEKQLEKLSDNDLRNIIKEVHNFTNNELIGWLY